MNHMIRRMVSMFLALMFVLSWLGIGQPIATLAAVSADGVTPQVYSWVNLSPASPPGPRVGHALVDLPGRNRALLFGGSSDTTVYNDTWEFRYDTNTWTNRQALTPPPPLAGCNMAYDPDTDRVILYGGAGTSQTPTSTQTWSYDYNTNSWTALAASNPPAARATHGMVFDPIHHKVLLFGGRSDFPPAGSSFGDTWAYDSATNAWTNLNPALAPSARESQGMAWIPGWNRVLLFGGHSGGIPGTFTNDTWAYDPESNLWSNLNPGGSKPPVRFGSSLCYASGVSKPVLFGGITPNYLAPDLNDTWTYDRVANSWTNLNPANSPPGRQGAVLGYDDGGGRIVIFGGHSGLIPGTWLNDTWTLPLVGSLATITLLPSIQTVTVGLTATLTALARDASGNSVGNRPLLFTVSGSHPCTATSTTNSLGEASWTYTATSAGSDSVIASANGISSASAGVEWQHGSASQLRLSPGTATILAGTSQPYTLQAIDFFGNGWDITAFGTYSITPSAGGAWNGATYTSEQVGTWQVSASYSALASSATLVVLSGVLARLTLTPSTATLPVGNSQAHAVRAGDAQGNPLPNLTVSLVSSGAHPWSKSATTDSSGQAFFSYTATSPGIDTLRASIGIVQSNTATVSWTHAALDHILLQPQTATIQAGNSQNYTVLAFDAFGGSWDVTLSSFFQIEVGAGGSWVGSIYTAHFAGNWTVTASYDNFHSHANLNVYQGPTAGVAISPLTATIVAGDSRAYSLAAHDNFGNSWDVSDTSYGSSFAVLPDGAVLGNTVSATRIGLHTVTGSYEGYSDHASLAVIAGPLANLTLTPSQASLFIGQDLALQVLALDSFWNPVSQLTVAFTVSGAHSLAGQATTGADGVATWSYTGTVTGIDTILASTGTLLSQPAQATWKPLAQTFMYYFRSSWNQITMPLVTSPSPAIVFSGLGAGWGLFEWDPLHNTYLPPAQIVLRMGVGYWLKSPAATEFEIVGLSLGQPIEIPLANTWNMVGNPYLSDLPLASLRIQQGGITYTLSQAGDAGLILRNLYIYNGSGYDPASLLAAGGGYWLKSLATGCSLLFSPPP